MISNVDEINYGVPEGSYLRPLLFLLCTYDLSYSLQKTEVTVHANDGSILLLSLL